MINTTSVSNTSIKDIIDFGFTRGGGGCDLCVSGTTLMEAVVCNLDWLIKEYHFPNITQPYHISVRRKSCILGGKVGYAVYITVRNETHTIWVRPVKDYLLVEQDVIFDNVQKKITYDSLNPHVHKLAKLRKPLDEYLDKKTRSYRWYCDGSASRIYIHYEDGDTFARNVMAEDAVLLSKYKDRAVVYLVIKYYYNDDLNTDWMTVR